jgi:hypothetical protein
MNLFHKSIYNVVHGWTDLYSIHTETWLSIPKNFVDYVLVI